MRSPGDKPAPDEKFAAGKKPFAHSPQPAAGENPAIDEMSATNDQTPTDNRQLSDLRALGRKCRRLARSRHKQVLLTQIRDLALEGYSSQEIGARLGMGKSTVHRWLQEMRQECRTSVADATEMISNAVARYDTIYREAMQAWRNSKADKEVQIVEDTDAVDSGSGSKMKKSVRTERRAGEIAFLAQARGAVDAIFKILPPNCGPITWYTLDNETIPDMSDAELLMVEAHSEERIQAEQRNE
jgi:transposase-like protein